LGSRRDWRVLSEESIVNLRSDRFRYASPGLFEAKPAQPSKATLNPGRTDERALTSKVAGLRLKQGDVFSWQLGGGGGLGNPYERDPERVRVDVQRGYVSLEAAQRDYGVVLDPADLTVNAVATARLRGQAAP
jgi:N-methylhydantoinase B